MGEKRILHEVDELQTTDELMERLNRWSKEPENDSEFDKWYKYGFPQGLPFEVKKSEQWELDHDIYFPMYEEALRLEKLHLETEALAIYLKIHEQFIPRGTVHYENPILLLEKKGHFDKAIELCEKYILTVSSGQCFGDVEPFRLRILRLQQKKKSTAKFSSYEQFVFFQIVETVKVYPDINLTLLQKELMHYDILDLREYIDKAVDRNLISRKKHGRSLLHNLPL